MPAMLTRVQWRQTAWITLGAVALFVVVRSLPTGTNLAHVDFQVPGGNVIQFCDPANPAFLPVVAVKSPVTMTLSTDMPPAPGRRLRVALVLRTFTGRPIGPPDLLETHTKRLHIMAIDPSLRDYQHIHPEPGRAPGEWEFTMIPRRAGLYRVFADFTPAVTGRGLYASAEFSVSGTPDLPPTTDNWVYTADGLRFTLTPDAPFRARAVVNLTLTIESVGGTNRIPSVGRPEEMGGTPVPRGAGILPASLREPTRSDLPPSDEGRRPVPLEAVMGTYAHLVAFDEARSGFAHIHPQPTDLNGRPDPDRPRLTFKVQIPRAGRYVIWSQIKTGGRERCAPFWFEVAP